MTYQSKATSQVTDAVTILMATYNGAKFIEAQLASIETQSHKNWSLWISDDGSSDETVKIVQKFATAHLDRDIRMFKGPQSGAARNFLSLLAHPDLPVGLTAFCDQDDVWFPNKLSRAVSQLEQYARGVPVGYACMDIATDRNLKPFPRQRRKVSFASFPNALVQNVMRGNAIVLNGPAVSLLRDALKAGDGTDIKHHDWWIYLTLSGLGCEIIIDQEPGLFYRQHGDNVIGADIGRKGFLTRARLLLQRQHQDWITRNLNAIGHVSLAFTHANRQALDDFRVQRNLSGFSGLLAFCRSDIRWQTHAGTFAMALQAFLGRL